MILSVAGYFSLLPLLFGKELLLVKYSLLLTYNFGLYSILKLLHIKKLYFRWYEKIYIFGFICLPVYEHTVHSLLKFDKKLPFFPLLLTSLYCSIGIIFVFFKYYFKFLSYNTKWNKNEGFKSKLKMK